MKSAAQEICHKHLGGLWSRIAPRDITVVPVSGGMSNTLFCCSLPELSPLEDGEPNQVLVRFYGEQYRDCDMSIQLEIFNLLSSKRLGPRLYKSFETGRIEEYLAADPLNNDQLTNEDISSIIARKLAIVHTLEVPISKDTSWLSGRLTEFIKSIEEQCDIESYLNEVKYLSSTKELARVLRAINYESEREFVQSLLDKMSSPSVFSHNDLHQGNILLAKPSKKRPTLQERVFFIDFEYCSYNYRSYDIANHFSEWCFEYDTPDYPHFIFNPHKFPSEEEQRRFVSDYLNQQRRLVDEVAENDDDDDKTRKPSTVMTKHGNKKTNGELVGSTGTHIEDILLAEIKPLTVAANFLWTLWCIKSAYHSKIKFGFWEHAMARWHLYTSLRASFV